MEPARERVINAIATTQAAGAALEAAFRDYQRAKRELTASTGAPAAGMDVVIGEEL